MLKSLKIILLSSAAVPAFFAVARAADMPTAEPVEHVRVCEIYGAGFWYIPGTQTCLRLGGYARFQTFVNSGDIGNDVWEGSPFEIADDRLDLNNDTFSLQARGLVNFDARTETSYGVLRSFVQIRGTADDEDNASVDLDIAFLQFAGFTAGLAPSFFIIGVPTEYFGTHVADFTEEQVLFGYTAEFGGGVSASVALESGERANQQGNWTLIHPDAAFTLAPEADWVEPGDTRTDMPALVANLRVEQGWGAASVAGAVAETKARLLHIDAETGAAVGEDNASEVGWAIAAGLTINLPALGESDSISFKAAYSENLNFYTVGALPSLAWTGDDATALGNVFTFYGGFTHYWTPTLRSNFAFSFVDADLGFDESAHVQGFTTSANLIWSPIEKLDIGVELLHARLEADGDAARSLGFTLNDHLAADVDEDAFGAIFRVQRSFGP